MLEKQAVAGHEDQQERVERAGVRISPKVIVAAVVAVLLVAFVLANTATTEINFLFTVVTAPMWLVLTIVIVVAFGAGMLASSFGRRRS